VTRRWKKYVARRSFPWRRIGAWAPPADGGGIALDRGEEDRRILDQAGGGEVVVAAVGRHRGVAEDDQGPSLDVGEGRRVGRRRRTDLEVEVVHPAPPLEADAVRRRLLDDERDP
jgi:hypothetical protein